MNLNIRQANATKSYVVTDVCSTRPRIAIKNGNNVSYLPLTTSAKQGFGLRNKVNGVNYRPLEYQSMSTSATYYTTAVASNGLSSTTALTRSSTSQTVYHTCSSTSGTSYLTRSSTSGTSYLTQYGNNALITIVSIQDVYSQPNSVTFTYHYSLDAGQVSSSRFSKTADVYQGQTSAYLAQRGFNITYPYRHTFGTLTRSFSYSNQSTNSDIITQAIGYASTLYIAIEDVNCNTNYPSYKSSNFNTLSQKFVAWANATSITPEIVTFTRGIYYYQSTARLSVTLSPNILTTGTSYLTRSSTSATSYLTRSSTSSTEYKTRASTSGYSGVSSSSSQSSGWL